MSAKTAAAVSAAIVLGLSASGCSADIIDDRAVYVYGSERPCDTAAENSSTADGAIELSETSKNNKDQSRELAEKFLDGLLEHDKEILTECGGAHSSSVYSFLDGVSINRWEIFDSVLNDADDTDGETCTYMIKLLVSESDCELFPVGESVWELEESDSDSAYFSSFRREGALGGNILADRVGKLDCSSAVKMSYAFTSEFGWLCSEDECIDLGCIDMDLKKERFTSNLIEFCCYFNGTESMLVDDTDYSAEWLAESAEKLLGIDELDMRSMPFYDAERNAFINNESAYCFGYSTLEDEFYDAGTGMTTVVLDWYADTIFLAKSCTFRYTLSDNGDGTLRLVSVDKLYDSGEIPVFFVKHIDFRN